MRKTTTDPLRIMTAMLVASAAPAMALEVPEQLHAAPNEALVVAAAARGVQVYECRAKKDASGYEWAFVAPEAELFDAGGKKLGKHYAGPHWEASDGSRVQGTVKARADAPAANAIPWLLLSTKSDGPEGSFAKVTSIQRVNTAGGVAPNEGCSQAYAGQTARIAYTADYYFFAPR